MRKKSITFSYPQVPEWAQALDICKKLNARGYTAYLAGGCVRDALLGRPPKDFDVATSARPEQVIELFPQSLLVGKAFGVVIVEGIEVATFRRDGPYSDGRHPDHVEFCSAQEDAQRRDFTVNALFYDVAQNQVIDYVEGLEDLQGRCLRTVGSPLDRFQEDLLRPLRALRFLAQLEGFFLDSATLEAIAQVAPRAEAVAKERVWQEWEKILLSSSQRRVESLKLLKSTGWWERIFPAWWQDLESLKLWDQLWQRHLEFRPPRDQKASAQVLQLMALSFYDELRGHWQGGEVAEEHGISNFVRQVEGWLKQAHTSGETQQGVSFLLLQLPLMLGLRSGTLAEGLRVLGSDFGYLLPDLALSLSESPEQSQRVHKLVEAYGGLCTPEGRLPKPLVGGRDLMALGVAQGPQVGQILAQVYDQQLEGLIESRVEALKLLETLLSGGAD